MAFSCFFHVLLFCLLCGLWFLFWWRSSSPKSQQINCFSPSPRGLGSGRRRARNLYMKLDLLARDHLYSGRSREARGFFVNSIPIPPEVVIWFSKKTYKFMQFVSHETRGHDVVTNKVTMWERICHSKIVPNDLWDEESASSISLFSYMNSILPVSNILPVNHHFGDEVIWGRWNLARYLCNVWWYLHHDLYISYPYTAYSLHSFPHIYIHTCPAWVNTSH